MKGHFPFASLAFLDLRFPVELFVTGIAKALGMMFFFLRAVAAFFYHHVLEKAFAY